MRTFIALAALAYLPSAVSAQDTERNHGTLFSWSKDQAAASGPLPMSTDRPDFTESSSTVGRGIAQLEFGYSLTRQGDSRTHAWGEPLLRLGVLAPWLELRFALAPVSHVAGMTTAGTEDIYVGAKMALAPQRGALPELAVVVQATLPTGSDAFTSGRALGGANLLYGWDVAESWSIAGSSQYNRASEAGLRSHGEWAQSFTVAHSLTDLLGSYFEWYGIFDEGGTQHYVNGGITIAATADVQFDVRAGLGLSESSEDVFIGSGVSIRFP